MVGYYNEYLKKWEYGAQAPLFRHPCMSEHVAQALSSIILGRTLNLLVTTITTTLNLTSSAL